ncbi:subtilisin-like protease SBT4.15 [Telopea speciosissima]|uniref:subtilisin-like protease SBT4.15 n=1 Tax=Telopea speciosissima TaxID=54955 RepID=UPI001CC6DB90|nr:subtilisin-like protease SBT4.15 [Telopea speciosissima]
MATTLAHGVKTLTTHESPSSFHRSVGSHNTTTTHRTDGSDNERKTYIVYMGDAPETGIPAVDDHHNLLINAIGDEQIARESRIHSYGKSFNAFAAMLLPHEAEQLKDKEGVVSVFLSKIKKLHTTSSWDFIGMPMTVKRNHLRESNVIVGILDSGIYMQSESFNDEGFGPPPTKWKGKCQTGPNFPGCNNKVIGARYYNLDPTLNITDPLSPEDRNGHGTHTASTVAGNPISGANYYGMAEGIARGGVPSARLAIYKVCWGELCSDLEILAALDDAIDDGVDVISMSLGGQPDLYYKDAIAIGTFHAMRKGIFTACSAGNEGPDEMSVTNAAPWIMTVAANTIDRRFKTYMKLGNGLMASGYISINTFSPEKTSYPLISGTLARNASFHDKYLNARFCDVGTLDASKVKGKIVYCYMADPYSVSGLHTAGFINAAVSNDTLIDTAYDFATPTVYVDANLDALIDRYINTTRNPLAVIYKSYVQRQPASPFLASFSSRGPDTISRSLLKPDISAPGVDILASWTMLATPTGSDDDKRHYHYNIISGTSMSCPHVAAVATYIKTFRPHWSPAAIKSALITTGDPQGGLLHLDGLGYGAGQIDPVRAVQPGLIYDLDLNSYISYLCKEGYNETTLGLLSGTKDLSCKGKIEEGYDGLNYPSMNLNLENNKHISAVFKRTVTNVGFPNSVYKATVKTPPGLNVKVIPNTLIFKSLQEKKTFKVVMKGAVLKGNDTRVLEASLEWNDKWHKVRSPILVYRPDAKYWG